MWVLVAGLLAASLLMACTDDGWDDSSSEDSFTDSTEGLFIAVDIDDMDLTTYTRATEDAWTSDDWNEKTIKRLDAFIYKQGNMTAKIVTQEVCSLYVTINESYAKYFLRWVTTTTVTTTTYTYTTGDDGTTTTTETKTENTTTTATQEAGDWKSSLSDTECGDNDGITTKITYSSSSTGTVTVTDDNGTTLLTLSASTTETSGQYASSTTTVYSYDYTCKLHDYYTYTETESEISGSWQLTYSDGSRIPATWLETTDSVFIVANMGWTTEPDSTTYSKPSELEALSATYYDSSSDYAYTKQTAIMMSGCVQAVNSTSNNNIITDSNDAYGNPQKRTVKVPLTRACAKICLHVWYKAEDATYYETQKTFSDNNAQVRLIHYTTAGPLFENGTYNNTADTTSTLYSNSPQMYEGTLTVTSSNQSIYGGTVGGTVDDYSAVYYVFPNNWYDSSKSMYEEAPINYSYWTHFLLAVTDTKAAMEYKYKYSIPINYLLPEDNDSSYPDPSYIDLYNIYRNHVYNVNVYVQEQAEGYIVTLSIEDLTEGTTIEISSDDDTSASVTIESLDTSSEYDYTPSD